MDHVRCPRPSRATTSSRRPSSGSSLASSRSAARPRSPMSSGSPTTRSRPISAASTRRPGPAGRSISSSSWRDSRLRSSADPSAVTRGWAGSPGETNVPARTGSNLRTRPLRHPEGGGAGCKDKEFFSMSASLVNAATADAPVRPTGRPTVASRATSRQMRLTHQLVSRIAGPTPDPGPVPGRVYATDADHHATQRELLAAQAGERRGVGLRLWLADLEAGLRHCRRAGRGPARLASLRSASAGIAAIADRTNVPA